MRRVLALFAVAACGGAPASSLQWFSTCGDPACSGHRDAGLAACTPQEEAGVPCSSASAECDPQNLCNSHLLCAASDPKQRGCPVSRMRFKKDIRYLSDAERSAYRDQLLKLPLATYRYRGADEGSRLHLGFMIDGHESLACVDGDTVDLYGYASMAVAALQSQEQEIAELRRELRQLRKERR
jgi:endosialidase-like protein